MAGRAWTERERQILRDANGKLRVRQLAKQLGRTMCSVHQQRDKLGLAVARRPLTPDEIRRVREMHAKGWSDAEMAKALGRERHTLGELRFRLGLPHNAYSEHRRRCVAEKTREQLRRAGLPSLAAVRREVFRNRARAAGWPDDLRPRAVQILSLLWEQGPQTRRQIAAAIGLPWKGSRKSLTSNDPEGSYLANLIKRGLVVSLGKIVKGKGKGHSTQLYSLPLWIERKAG